MSRAGYYDYDSDQWSLIRWRGAVASAIRGKRGQAFLREMLAAMDAMPEKKLVARELEMDGQVCAIGSVGMARGIDMDQIDPEDCCKVAETFGLSEALVREIVYENDEGCWGEELPEKRFQRMRAWIVSNIHGEL
ncbi:MAG TPA: hypothetical protein VGK56_12480 [Anaerolineales bacterium]